jgi:threonine/homoserine/homoserine lactone efflux protein
LSLFAFAWHVWGISLSGALAPGPLSAMAVARGKDSPHAGVVMSLGHAIVETLVIVGLFLGAEQLRHYETLWAVVGLAGAAVLVLMGVGMLAGALRRPVAASDDAGGEAEANAGGVSRVRRAMRSPLLAGALLSAGNPYFLVWWLTIGASLARKAVEFGTVGLAVLIVVHWSCDFGWLWGLSAAAHGGSRLLGPMFERGVFALCGGFLLFMAATFALGSMRTLLTGGMA